MNPTKILHSQDKKRGIVADDKRKHEPNDASGSRILTRPTRGRLATGYYRKLYQQWSQLEKTEQIEIVRRNRPETTAKILLLMMGEPDHNIQPQNRLKYGVFETVLRHNPQALAQQQPKGEPVWMEAVGRFNLHEDGTAETAMRTVGEMMYEGHEKEVWKRQCDILVRRMRGW